MTSWRGPAWQRRAKQARNNPPPTCFRCQLPILPGQLLDADHITAGDQHSRIAATHRHCNRSHGATRGNLMRTEPHTEQW